MHGDFNLFSIINLNSKDLLIFNCYNLIIDLWMRFYDIHFFSNYSRDEHHHDDT